MSSSLILWTKCDYIYLTAYLAANLYPDMIVVGCTLILINSFARRSNSAATTTTDVVPSPTSLSCNWLNSTITFAAGCSTSNYLRIVAPSLVIVTSPISSTSILSKPYGPNDVLTTFAIAITAVTLLVRTS